MTYSAVRETAVFETLLCKDECHTERCFKNCTEVKPYEGGEALINIIDYKSMLQKHNPYQ